MFPRVDTPEAWALLRADDAALRPGVEAICARHRLGREPIRRFPTGTLPVYAVGTDWVLKLFPPPDSDAALTEERALAAVEGLLPIPTPRIRGSGGLDGWRYVLMTQLEGRLLADAWPDIPTADRDRFAAELGETVAALHGIDTSALDRLQVDWPAFVHRQRETALARQRTRGLAAHWLEQIPGFLDAWMPAADSPLVLLHTELMREHLLVAPRRNRWELTGLFDFEPAMIGAAEYDFAAYGLFVSAGDPRFFGQTLRAYGRPDAIGDAAFAHRILACTLLHRYSNLHWYLQRLPPAPDQHTLESLAQRWFGATFDE